MWVGSGAMGRSGSDKEDEWGWQTVRKRKLKVANNRGTMDVAAVGSKACGDDTVTFYFSEIPETHGAKEMLRAFSYYGEVVEVVIPCKRNGRGKRFGFARFQNVAEPRSFAVKLDNIIIGAQKIFVNTPRFDRTKSEGRGVAVGVDLQKGVRKTVWRRKEDGRSHIGERAGNEGSGNDAGRGIVLQRNHACGLESSPVGTRNTMGWNGGGRRWEDTKTVSYPKQGLFSRKKNVIEMSYAVAEEVLGNLRKMFVGRLVNSGTGHMVQEWFNMQGIFTIKATPLGANFVLLEELEEGMLVSLNTDAADLLWVHFDDIRSWTPSAVDSERVVWVRCHGVPVHAWNEDFFGRLANNFGVMLGVDDNTRKKSSMDVARILIRTRGFVVLNEVIHAKINGEMFFIKILEEWCGPMRWDGLTNPKDDGVNDVSPEMDDGSDDDVGPPLFTTENEGYVESECEEDDEEVGEVKGLTVVKGSVWEKVGAANDENKKQKDANEVGSNDDVISSNIAAQVEQGSKREQEKTNKKFNEFFLNDVGPIEVDGQCAEVVEEWGDESGPLSGGILVRANTDPEENGKCISSKEGNRPAKTTVVKERGAKCGAGNIDTGAETMAKNKKGKMKKQERWEGKKGKGGNSNGDKGRVTLGCVPGNGISLAKSLSSSSAPFMEGVQRRFPSSRLSFSINTTGGEELLGETSIGDSGIKMGNARAVIQHEISLAKKVWSIATDDLGVTGAEEEDTYCEKIEALEKRDQEAKAKKGNHIGHQ